MRDAPRRSLPRSLIRGGSWLAIMLAVLPGVGRAETLADAVNAAYATNPTLGAERARQRTYDEDYVQARAAFSPSLSLTGQDSDSFHRIGRKAPSDTRFKQGNQTNQVVLQLNQSIYDGGRNAATVSAASSQILAGREYLRSVESQVVYDTISAYMAVLRDQDRVTVSRDNVAALEAELVEAKARFAVRQVTRTDVAQSEGRFLGAQAQLASYQAQLAISAGQYTRIVGHPPGQLAPAPALLDLPGSIEQALDAAEAANPDLGRAKYAEQVSRAKIDQAKGARRASISASVQYGYSAINAYDRSSFAPYTKEYDRELATSVTVRVPLFQGGALDSTVRQSIAQNGADDMTIETTRRTALQNVVQAWHQLYAARSGLTAFEAQTRAFLLAYEGVRREEPFGLRSRIEVLNAEQELQSAQLQLVSARYDEYVGRAALLAAMGRLTAQSIDPKSGAYQPDAYFRAVRRKGAVPWTELLRAVDGLGLKPVTKPAPADLTDLHPSGGPASLPMPPQPTADELDRPMPSIASQAAKP